MSHTIWMVLAPASGLIVLAACATTEDSAPATTPDAAQDAGGGSDAFIDAADATPAPRPLLCGDAGFCETKLPTNADGVLPSLRSVWVVASDDVWSVSSNGWILHYDGAAWSTVYRANHELYSVWATASDAWVGGESGLLLHRDGAGAWTLVDTRHAAPIRAIAGTSASDIWMMSRDGSVDHFDGTTLTNHSITVPGLRITTVFGRPGVGVFAAGYVPDLQLPPIEHSEHTPYVLELTASKISTFSGALTEQKRFIPVAGVVTGASEADRRILLSAYRDDGEQRRAGYCLFGKEAVAGCDVLVRRVIDPEDGISTFEPGPDVAPIPVAATRPDKFIIPYQIGAIFQWDGATFAKSSLAMGQSFSPTPIFGIHHDTKDMWIVGEGFALKGPTP